MSKKTKRWLKIGLVVGLILLVATPSFTRPITMKEVVAAVWVLMIIGAIIVSLQLIPAAILFFSIVGIICLVIFKGFKKGIA